MGEKIQQMITDIEQETSDIDWFFTNGKEVGFVASGGGILPKSVSKRSFDEIELLATYFRGLPKTSKTIIDTNLKEVITSGNNTNEYLSSFIEMAEKGFFSFDKSVINRFSDTNYHLVATPINPLKFDDLPSEISKILAETKINSNIEASLNINLIE
ncbi:MAG: hypothetical protein ACXVAY_03175 [Mucilaginibacter sp.]